MPTMEKGPLSALETTCRTREPKQQATTRKRKDSLVAAQSGEATLEFEDKQQATARCPLVGDSQVGGQDRQNGAAERGMQAWSGTQQSIESPGVWETVLV
jgi:hypothetical protein